MKEMNSQHITLLPFTFDSFGSMGPIATVFFFHKNLTYKHHPQILQKKYKKEGLIAYYKSIKESKLLQLFNASNKIWKSHLATGFILIFHFDYRNYSTTLHHSGIANNYQLFGQ